MGLLQYCTNLAELAHGMKFVVGADELEVLHRRHSHAPVKVKAVVPLCVGRFPRLKKEHVSVSTLLDARQLQGSRRRKSRSERAKYERWKKQGGGGLGRGVLSAYCGA